MMKNNLCITTLLLWLHFNFPWFSFLSVHNSASAQIQNFRLSDYAILLYVHDVYFSINTLISCKNSVVFRMFVALDTIFLRSQVFGCYISTVKFHRILVISVSESVKKID